MAGHPESRREVRGVRDPTSTERKFFDAISLMIGANGQRPRC